MQYAHAHDGQFPLHDYVGDISAKNWEAPDSTGTRYLYVGGVNLGQTNALLACEPISFGENRMVLFVSGKIQTLKAGEIHRLFGAQEKP